MGAAAARLRAGALALVPWRNIGAGSAGLGRFCWLGAAGGNGGLVAGFDGGVGGVCIHGACDRAGELVSHAAGNSQTFAAPGF